MNLDDQHVDDLLAAYALGALEPDEVDAVERHLEHCPHCRARAEEARATAAQLLLAAPLVEPPPSLRARTLDRIRAEAAGHARGDPERDGVASANAVTRLLRSVFGGPPEERHDADRVLRELLTDPACVIWPVAGTDNAPGAGGRLVGVPGRHEAVLVTNGLAPSVRGQEYQVWFLRGGKPQPNALFTVGHGGHGVRVVHVPDPLRSFEVVAVTPEPAGGSPGPTGPIVLAGELAS